MNQALIQDLYSKDKRINARFLKDLEKVNKILLKSSGKILDL